MKLYQIMIILCATGLALAMYTPYQNPKVCIKLSTGVEGELVNNLFCDDQVCRPITVDYEKVDCDD